MADLTGGDRFNARARIALLAAIAVGVSLRFQAFLVRDPSPDAREYTALARELPWTNPWQAGFREPMWTLLTKAAMSPLGYSSESLQLLTLTVSCVGLLLSACALRSVFPAQPWAVVVGTAAVAVSRPLVLSASAGDRDAVSVVAVSLAIVLAAKAPSYVPLLAAVTLGIRWEVGIGLFVASAILALRQHVPLRRVAIGLLVAAVIVGPFLVNNKQTFGDPMFHSNVHATVTANIDPAAGRASYPADVLRVPEEERLHPLLRGKNWRGPLITWIDYTGLVGTRQVLAREALATVRIPVQSLRLGLLPTMVGAVAALLALLGFATQRDTVGSLIGALSAVLVAGYGVSLPVLPPRLLGIVLLPMLILTLRGATEVTSRWTSRISPTLRRYSHGFPYAHRWVGGPVDRMGFFA